MNKLKNAIAGTLIHWGCRLLAGKPPKYPPGGNAPNPHHDATSPKHARMAIPVAIPYHQFKNDSNSSAIMKSYLANGARSLVEQLYDMGMFECHASYDELSEEYHFTYYLDVERKASLGEPVTPIILKPEALK